MKQLLYAIVVIFLVLLARCIAPVTDAPTAATPVTRRITHALGESEVSADPQRGVVLATMDNVLALGITPVSAANWIGTATGEQAAFPPAFDRRARDNARASGL